MLILLQLFLALAKVGVMTFGGGYAMLPIMQRELVENECDGCCAACAMKCEKREADAK